MLGDSITQGLGSKKVSFADELARLVGDGFEVMDEEGTVFNRRFAFGPIIAR